MRYQKKQRSKLFLLLLLLIVISSGCGGGTSGTGVTSVYDAVLQDGEGNALSGVTVTVLETGDSAVTDANGHFSIEVDPDSSTNTIIISTPTGDSVVDINTDEPATTTDGAASGNGIQIVGGETTTSPQQGK